MSKNIATLYTGQRSIKVIESVTIW